MFNSQTPSQEDLPTSKQLLRSTIISIIVATAVLVVAVLPAEYGVDPTGIGSLLGLKSMGEIKVGLEHNTPTQSVAILKNKTITITNVPPIVAANTKPMEQVENSVKKDLVEYTLAPGEAIEFKLEMKKGAVAQYKWSTANGKLNHDTHGDGYKGSKEFVRYKKGSMVTSDQGEIKAAFGGYHGWFWRNRDSQSVSVKLETNGDYIELKRMM